MLLPAFDKDDKILPMYPVAGTISASGGCASRSLTSAVVIASSFSLLFSLEFISCKMFSKRSMRNSRGFLSTQPGFDINNLM